MRMKLHLGEHMRRANTDRGPRRRESDFVNLDTTPDEVPHATVDQHHYVQNISSADQDPSLQLRSRRKGPNRIRGRALGDS
jgi:hypothetical protein